MDRLVGLIPRDVSLTCSDTQAVVGNTKKCNCINNPPAWDKVDTKKWNPYISEEIVTVITRTLRAFSSK
jgi:hypothetical protein